MNSISIDQRTPQEKLTALFQCWYGSYKDSLQLPKPEVMLNDRNSEKTDWVPGLNIVAKKITNDQFQLDVSAGNKTFSVLYKRINMHWIASKITSAYSDIELAEIIDLVAASRSVTA